MNNCKNIFLIAAVSVNIISWVIAQPTNLKFDHIGLEQGLSQSSVYAIVRDAQGFMWFGTQNGLNRYDGYSIKVFKHNPDDSNSISDNMIWCLLSDTRGDLWIGTERGGVDRYILAENRFYNYKLSEDNSADMDGNRVTSLYEDSNGNIWVGTSFTGLTQLSRTTGRFTRFLFDEKDTTSLNSRTVWAICEDNARNLWIATTKGLYKLNIDKQTEVTNGTHFAGYHYIPSNSLRLNSDNIRALYVDREGTLWIGTSGGGLIRYDVKTNTFKRYLHNALDQSSISSNYIQSIYEDSRQNLWIATYDAGLIMFDHQIDSFVQYTDDDLRTLYVDRSGTLWIGSFVGGVKVYDWRKNRFKHYYTNNQNDMSGNIVLAILQDKEGELWVGTFRNGLKRFDRRREKVLTYNFDPKNPNSLSSNRILSLCESLDGSIWIGTNGGGLNSFDKKKGKFTNYRHKAGDRNNLSSNQILVLHEAQNGDLWIGHINGGIDKFNKATKTFEHYQLVKEAPTIAVGTSVNVIYEDKSGIIWVGIGGVVYRLIPETNLFEQYQFANKPHSNIKKSRDDVSSIWIDDKGFLWIGTFGGGLRRYSYTTPNDTGNSFSYYSSEHGLSNDVVYAILPDKSGNLWLSTNKGISRFNPRTETFKNYNVKDGLQGDEFNQGAYYASPSGELFFGGINGFNSFFPDEIEDNEYIPPVYLTKFKVLGEVIPLPNPIPNAKQIELSYSQNIFSFEFVALNYTSPEKNQYAYMLEGFDTDWHMVSAQQRYASYTNLGPGEYVLRVKGSNNDGIWNEKGTSLTIIIRPPFWMTWWFRTLLVIVVVGLFIAAYNYHIAQLLKIERMRIRIASDLHDEIGSNLSGIALASQITQGQHELDRHRLLKIKENALETIDIMHDIIWFIKPEHDNPVKLIARMKDLADSLLTNLNYTVNSEIDAFADLTDIEVRQNIFLIYKECLTNIVRHAQCTRVEIDIANNGYNFLFRIADNGVGFDPHTVCFGSGIRNIRTRAARICFPLLIESSPGTGTIIELRRKK